jgi:hypothetical protein
MFFSYHAVFDFLGFRRNALLLALCLQAVAGPNRNGPR